MHKNNIAYLVALAMVAATTTVPMTSADPEPYDHFEDAQGPAGIYQKDTGALAVAFCLVNQTFPASCNPQPGAPPAVGGAFFIVDGSDPNIPAWPDTGYGRAVRINVEQISGQVLGGFAIHACTDYNDDIECDSGDWAISNDSDPSCATDPEEKDKKNCTDPTDAGLIFCAERDFYTRLPGSVPPVDHSYDDFVVFVTLWEDVADDDAGGLGLFDNPKDNTDAGLSFGQFRVYADWTNQQGFVDRDTCDELNRFDQVNGAETGVVVERPQCSDGRDNESTPDGTTDYPDDPECDSPEDNDESA